MWQAPFLTTLQIKKLVFKNDDSLVKTGMEYFGLAVGLFVLDTLLIRLFFTVFGINLLIAKVIVGILLFAVSWTVQKKLIFKERTSTVLWNFLKKPYAYASVLGLLLTGSFSYSMLKTFVLAETISAVATTNTSSNTAQASQAAKTATVTNSSYKDDNISIKFWLKRRLIIPKCMLQMLQ